VEIYCLRQVRHQINEFPFVLQGLPSLDILIIFYRCISIVSKRVHLDPYPWIFFLRALGRTCTFARAYLVLLRAAWAVSSTSRSFGKKMGFGILWPLTAANLKFFYSAGTQKFSPSL